MEISVKEKWMMKTTNQDCVAIAGKYNISPIAAFLIMNRGVEETDIPKYLQGDINDMYAPEKLKDLEKSVEIIKEKVRQGKKIRIVGDYDIDGVCATYILTDAIRSIGGNVDKQIPERIKDGYGINDNIIYKAIEDGIDTIITCDNGIAAIDQAVLAKENGITYIITDHHEVPFEEIDGIKNYTVPKADCVVNHKQEDCTYPFKGLCGGAVAYKVAEKLIKNREKRDEYLMFAAIATIGDVMELRDENRIIVRKGLSLIRKTDHIGLSALIKATKLKQENIDSYHIGFVLGPCINASGRLETAEKAFDLLNARTVTEAAEIAAELVELNEQRKTMTKEQTETAIAMAKATEDRVLVIYLPECHESIAGIVAGKVREAVCRPVYIVTKSENGYKGSGRSIESYDMYEEMTKCKEYFEKFGGHKMAAGFSFADMAAVEGFKKKINAVATLTEEDFVSKVLIDMEVKFPQLSESFVEGLNMLEPFGNGNEKPVFALKNAEILKIDYVGKMKNYLKLSLADDSGYMMTAMYFGDKDEFLDNLREKYGEDAVNKTFSGKINDLKLTATYYPQINEYNGTKTVNIVIGHYC